MAWLRKKTKGRRVSSEKAKPVKEEPFFPEAPPEKRAGRYVITAGFLAIAVLLLAWGRAPATIRLGQRAERDIKARVDFEVEDPEETRKARDIAEARAPRVYSNDEEKLKAVAPRIIELLRQIGDKEIPSLEKAPPEVSSRLTSQSLDALQKGLDHTFLSQIKGKIETLFTTAARKGVMEQAEHRNEQVQGRLHIRVYTRAGRSPQERSIFEVVSFPRAFRETVEVQLARQLSQKPPEFKKALLDLILEHTFPTLHLDSVRSKSVGEAARRSVQPVIKRVRRDSFILHQGEVATEQVIRELAAEARVYHRTHAPGLAQHFFRLAGTTIVVLVIYLVFGMYLAKNRSDIMRSNTRLFALGVAAISVLVIAKIFMVAQVPLLLAPLPLLAMILVVAYGQALGLGAAFAVALLLGILFKGRFPVVLVLVVGAAVGGFTIVRLRRRVNLIEVGFLTGLAQLCAAAAMALIGTEKPATGDLILNDVVAAFCNGAVSGLILTGALPFMERAFGVVTDLSLLEWSDQNQPLLRKLLIEAPGTYHHSIIVGHLAEAAANAIGASPLVARVSAFLHDVGKLNKPEYFIENTENKPSRHESLSPMMSTLIITAHTKDGVEIAERYNVPEPVRDIIEQHHGTSLVEFFYNEALARAGENDKVDKEMFRYRGPRPRTPEAAIVLLADAIESASRTLSDPTPSRIESLVREIIRNRLMDGQLDESGLTLTDVHKVEQSITRVLVAMFHQRIRYPNRRPA